VRPGDLAYVETPPMQGGVHPDHGLAWFMLKPNVHEPAERLGYGTMCFVVAVVGEDALVLTNGKPLGWIKSRYLRTP
jgi:hypothetical protein